MLLIDERIAEIESRIEATVGGQGELLTRLTSQLAVLDAGGNVDPGGQSEALLKITTTVAEFAASRHRRAVVFQADQRNRRPHRERDQGFREDAQALIRLGENQHTLASAHLRLASRES